MRTYTLTWAALVVLTLASFFLTASVGTGTDVSVSLAIAFIKAFLVALFFMHLAKGKVSNQVVLLVSVIFVLILVALTALDVVFRGDAYAPPLF